MKIKRNYPIAHLSTFKIGGRASYFCEVKNDKELLEAIGAAKKLKLPYKLIAGGSNILFPDGVLNCFLIKIKKLSSGPAIKINGNKIMADAGTGLMAVVKTAVSRGLRGLETLSGIPGTIGGAVVGNAGAYGHSVSEVVEKVEIWDGKKKRWLKNKDCRFGYRHSIFKEKPWIVLRLVLKLKKGNSGELKKISQDILKIRSKYKGICCAGSFFKNVPVKDAPIKSLKLIPPEKITGGKISVGYLLEQVGAQGMKIGKIKVADFHCNFIINTGSGRACDVKKLAQILKNRVKKKFGLALKEEVRYF